MSHSPTPVKSNIPVKVSLSNAAAEVVALRKKVAALEQKVGDLEKREQKLFDLFHDPSQEDQDAVKGVMMRRFGFTKSEADVGFKVFQGKSNKEIAALTFRSEQTVDVHLDNAFKKVDVHVRAELANLIMQLFLQSVRDGSIDTAMAVYRNPALDRYTREARSERPGAKPKGARHGIALPGAR